MKLTIAISLVAHAILLMLLGASLPRRATGVVSLTVFDPQAPPRAQPSTTRPVAARAVEHAPRPHRRVARSMPQPQPVPQAPPLPDVQPADEPAFDGDGDGGDGQATARASAAPLRPDLRRDPDLDPGSCTRGLEYPDEVRKLKDEVVVRLRVELDDWGQVREASVLATAGQSFDATALKAVREKCRFTAALDERGQPVPYIIDDYRFHFRRVDFQSQVGHFLLQ